MFHVEHEKISECPICSCTDFKEHLSVKDHFYSKQEFKIVRCHDCGLLITNPRPNSSSIGSYYNSEEYISHNSNKSSLLSSLYKVARNLNFKRKFKHIQKYEKTNLLDYGAGEGLFVRFCSNNGVSAKGFEPNPQARENAASHGIELLDSLPANDKFHNITLWHVMEHVHDLNATLSSLVDLLEPSGRMIVALPNPESHDCLHYGSNWAAYDVPRHLWHFNQSQTIRLLKNHGLKHLYTSPLKFDAYYISMLSEQYSNRSKLFGLLNGLKSNLKAKQHGGYSSQIYVFEKT